jgi:large subunit ribosomal protein L3
MNQETALRISSQSHARMGLVAKKIGMTRVFDSEGRHVPVTVLEVRDVQVLAHRTQDKNGYTAVQLGAFNCPSRKLSKPQRGFFNRLGKAFQSKEKVLEFRVERPDDFEVGQSLGVDFFEEGQYLDVTAISIGKGFAGGMKRHNFGGLRASHGVSISHRSHGSTGNRTFPGRVFKNKKMAGHLGHERVTIQNLRVALLDVEKGILGVKGAVPGPKGGFVVVREAVKKPQKNRSQVLREGENS